MKWLQKYGIVLVLAIALSNQFLQKIDFLQIPFLAAYLDDILCMPLFLSLWNWERQKIWQWGRLELMDVLGLTVFIFVLFEFILPHYIASCTSDWYDGLAYASGSSLYWWLWR